MYFPVFWFLKKILPEKYSRKLYHTHQGITHSFLGAFVSSVYFFVLINIVFYLIYFSVYTLSDIGGAFIVSFAAAFGFFLGNLIHFFQDSYSGNNNPRYGIRPFFPFSKKNYYGSYSSWNNSEKGDKLLSGLYFALLLLIPGFNIRYFESVEPLSIAVASILLFNVSVIIGLFLLFSIKFDVKSSKNGKIIYLKDRFILYLNFIILLNLLIYYTFV